MSFAHLFGSLLEALVPFAHACFNGRARRLFASDGAGLTNVQICRSAGPAA